MEWTTRADSEAYTAVLLRVQIGATPGDYHVTSFPTNTELIPNVYGTSGDTPWP